MTTAVYEENLHRDDRSTGPRRQSAQLRPTERVQTSGEFRRIKDNGRRYRTDSLRINYLATTRETSRLGLVVSKRHGKAVVRNRIKRRLREAFRLTKHELATPHDIVLLPSGGIRELDEYLSSLHEFTAYLRERLCRSDRGRRGGGR